MASNAKQTTKHIGRPKWGAPISQCSPIWWSHSALSPQFILVWHFRSCRSLGRLGWKACSFLKVQDANHLLPQLFLSELNWGLFGTPFYAFLCPKTLNEKNSKTAGAEPSHRSFSWSSPTFFWKSKGMHLLNQNGFRGPKRWDLEIRALPSREGTQNTKGYKTKPGDQ